MSESDIKQNIKEYIIQKYNVKEEELDENTNLFEKGIIDSMGAFDLVTFLEQTFAVKFEEEHFFDQRFRFIQGIVAIITEIKVAAE